MALQLQVRVLKTIKVFFEALFEPAICISEERFPAANFYENMCGHIYSIEYQNWA